MERDWGSFFFFTMGEIDGGLIFFFFFFEPRDVGVG